MIVNNQMPQDMIVNNQIPQAKFEIKKQLLQVQNWTLINFFDKFELFSIFKIHFSSRFFTPKSYWICYQVFIDSSIREIIDSPTIW